MLIAFSGYVSGYNGSFEFKEPGVSYEDYPYYGMRLVSVVLVISVIEVWNCFESVRYTACT